MAESTDHLPPNDASPPHPPAHSLAVLPFVNMSGDPGQDYFSDGLADEVLDSLATIPDLHVMARTSSFSFKGKDVTLVDIGRRLNVGAVLEGSVKRQGSHVRITVQLVDASSGFHLWSQTYDRDLQDVLAVETSIATEVTRALQVELLADARSAIDAGGTRVAPAMDAYLRGIRWRGNTHTRADVTAALREFGDAIRLDPGFAKAHVQEALFLVAYADWQDARDVPDAYRRARAEAEQAVTLAPRLGEAHAALAYVLALGLFDLRRVALEADRAAALAPDNAEVLAKTAHVFSILGRLDQAVATARRAVALDPLSAAAHQDSGWALLYARRYQDAIAEFDHVLGLNPDYKDAMELRGTSYMFLGELDTARGACARRSDTFFGMVCLALVYDRMHRDADAERELATIKTLGDTVAYQIADIYGCRGNTAQALAWVEKAYALRDPGLAYLSVDACFDSVRQEPRFLAILHRLRQ